MKPCDAKTDKQICDLRASIVEHGDYSLMLVEGEVVLSDHPAGREIVEQITLPRAVFEKFVKWYQTEQKPRSES